jgi:hypothetical protein
MMMVPDAANMPPTPRQTEILAPVNLGGGGTAHLATLSGDCGHATQV